MIISEKQKRLDEVNVLIGCLSDASQARQEINRD